MRLGYSVLLAGDGEEALEVAQAHQGPIDLLLTDVVMPKMNGRELAQELARRIPDIKVLYASGYTENIIAHHGVLKEGVRFLPKPYTLNSLGRAVHDALEAKQSV